MKTTDPSGEIISTTKISVRPENRKELCLTINSLLDLIRHEDGCRECRFYGDADDQNSFMLVGEWETKAAWNNHLHSEHFAVLLGSLILLSNRPEVDFKLLSHVSGTEALTRARCNPMEGM